MPIKGNEILVDKHSISQVDNREVSEVKGCNLNMKIKISLVTCMVLLGFLGVCQGGTLRKRFYRDSCPQAEDIIKSKIQQHVSTNPNLPAKLLRLHFHDCFVRVY